MKRKTINLKKKLELHKDQLSRLGEMQMGNFLGGRMAAATHYTADGGTCSAQSSSCCSTGQSSCCG